jgi:serine/threonine protein kinase
MERYTLVKQIGKGSYGAVYLAKLKADGCAVRRSLQQTYVSARALTTSWTRAPRLSRRTVPLVIKRVKVDNANEAASAQQEARLLAELDHPFIVGYVDSFLHKGYLCLVTEYCEGGDLYRRLKESALHLPEATIVDWLVQTAQALAHLHSRQIMHRDLKTQNIFLTASGVAKLGDFGIARLLKSGGEMAQTIVGTPFFMSPELMASKPYDLKTDLWSLGCVLHEMCCLEHAFCAEDMNGLALKILRGTHSPAPACYSTQLRQLINVLLSKDPDQRPTAAELLDHPLLAAHIQNKAEAFAAEATAHTARLSHARQVAALPPGMALSPSVTASLLRGRPHLGGNNMKALRASAPNVAIMRISREESGHSGGQNGSAVSPADPRNIKERLDREAEVRRSLEANIRRLQAGGSPDAAAARVAAARLTYARQPRLSSGGAAGHVSPPPHPRVSQSSVSQVASPPIAERPRRVSHSASPPPRASHSGHSAAVNAQRVTQAAAALAVGVGGDKNAPRMRRFSHAGSPASPHAPPGRLSGDCSPASASPPSMTPPRPRTSLVAQRCALQMERRESSSSNAGAAAFSISRLEREVDAVQAALVAPRARRHSEYVMPTTAQPTATTVGSPSAAAQQRSAALAALRARGAERHATRRASVSSHDDEDDAGSAGAAVSEALASDEGGPVMQARSHRTSDSTAAATTADTAAEIARLQRMHAQLTAHITELQATLMHEDRLHDAPDDGHSSSGGDSSGGGHSSPWEDTPGDGTRTPSGAEGQSCDDSTRQLGLLLPTDAFSPGGGGANARVAALRAACVESLGSPLFDKLYAHFREAQHRSHAGDGAAGVHPERETDETAFREELRSRLGPGRAHFMALIDRLLYEEEMLAAH